MSSPAALPTPGDYKNIAAQYARAQALKEREAAATADGDESLREQIQAMTAEGQKRLDAVDDVNKRREGSFKTAWNWTAAFFLSLLLVHAAGIYFFTRGFLLTRLVLEEQSSCSAPPIDLVTPFRGAGTPDSGCWHPKTFDKAIVVIIDALRYDFTIPSGGDFDADPKPYHDALPFMHELAVTQPHNAFLRPFIADPPTTTLQRLKGLTTGTLPTFIDAGSNFAGTAIDEDNLLTQLRDAGRRMVHLGDDTWLALFPDFFEAGLSHAYDSFNVHDLHTVDNGVLEHIFPLLEPQRRGEWDVIFAHFLGVDHAGHRYGPDHAAMRAKLQQMDQFVKDTVAAMDDDTLLVVMGDHGMDRKGDHGGESDEEIEAALWMYSRKGIFGRTKPEYVQPPTSAKIRPVNQIDLVPTLALLLGVPIPFNNLGKPIEEAFAGKKGTAWDNLAQVSRMTAAGIKRYQAAYYAAQGVDENSTAASALASWSTALTAASAKKWQDSYAAFTDYQMENLRVCRGLWARFDVPSMFLGIGILALGLFNLLQYVGKNRTTQDVSETDGDATGNALLGGLVGAGVGFLGHSALRGDDATLFDNGLCAAAAGILLAQLINGGSLSIGLPSSIWGWMALVFTVSQSVGFASNSYTIWEDSVLLFFLSTFGLTAAVSSMRQKSIGDRTMGIYHSLMFVIMGWVASYSKLCREEQAGFCFSTYYASSNSSTSALWQVLIPYLVALVIPKVIKSYYEKTRSFRGSATIWINWGLPIGLFLNAIFWTMDSADDGGWIVGLPEHALKNGRVIIARTVLALAFMAGMIGFVWATPSVTITQTSAAATAQKPGPRIMVLGYANAHGTRYFPLVLNVLVPILLVQKPMGAGSIGLMAWQILCLLEILDANALSDSAIGPVMLGVLGSFHFFKTGHQAVLSTIQWESAFVPLHTIRYPWSPLLVVLNSFGAQILATVAVPLVALWKKEPREKALLRKAARAVAFYMAYFAVISLATTMWAGHLRRHLMLYRIFSPRFMTGAFLLLVVDVVAVGVALTGVRVSTPSVRQIFGWP